ncbi:MAG: sulfatase-like hydrolase/transferase [Polyangiaceae bacterium]
MRVSFGPVVELLVDAAAVVFAWATMLLAEDVAMGFFWRDQFSAAWEVTLARSVVAPIALATLAPLSIVVVAGWRLARRAAAGTRAARMALGVAGAVATSAVAIGISHGRHFDAEGIRGAFVATLALAGAILGARMVPYVSSLQERSVLLAGTGLFVAIGGWLADAFVLPRLYLAFHLAMATTSLLGAAMVAFAARSTVQPSGRVARALASGVGALVVLCLAFVPNRVRALDRATNLRIVLVEHAPLLGRVVAAVTRLRPAPSEVPAAASVAPPGEVARSLDWSGHDVLLLSVDALRADHVSAYGYGRPTTPNIDALAREGTLFESAYCPTPHTSYSITSMMTGKYLRPLIALGLGSDSETWAQDLRRYGWRTAAFYPPAVFFIDEARFARFEQTHLGFEYAKVEFAAPALREEQVRGYLDDAPTDRPLFLWVHFFEPHEPYVLHADHPFGGGASPDVDAYDSEVATADEGIGRIVRLVRARRPGAAIVVTADHGEEFGEHGGRYHGTTVYEEQVRVPLVVVGPGVASGTRVPTVVQTIDVLPTVLSALGIPRPARLRGRDLGPVLAGDARAIDEGFAFAETDDASLVASGGHRLVCDRRAAACALYRLGSDPVEHHDLSRDEAAPFARLRGLLQVTERDHGRYEGSGVSGWPEALRRGLQGDVEAAEDVVPLLDDADVGIRRAAASVCFALHVPATLPGLARALARDEDDEVRRWCALAVARMGQPPSPLVDGLLVDADGAWRHRAALVLAERGEPRACDEMAAWWNEVAPPEEVPRGDGEPSRLSVDLPHAEEMLEATSHARCRGALGALLRALDDVRARPYVADALGALGDARASGPLLALFASEPYVTTRPHEAQALVALGVRDWASPKAETEVRTTLTAPGRSGTRLLALLSDANASLEVSADGLSLPSPPAGSAVRAFELEPRPGRRVALDVRASGGAVVALWMLQAGRLD